MWWFPSGPMRLRAGCGDQRWPLPRASWRDVLRACFQRSRGRLLSDLGNRAQQCLAGGLSGADRPLERHGLAVLFDGRRQSRRRCHRRLAGFRQHRLFPHGADVRSRRRKRRSDDPPGVSVSERQSFAVPPEHARRVALRSILGGRQPELRHAVRRRISHAVRRRRVSLVLSRCVPGSLSTRGSQGRACNLTRSAQSPDDHIV